MGLSEPHSSVTALLPCVYTIQRENLARFLIWEQKTAKLTFAKLNPAAPEGWLPRYNHYMLYQYFKKDTSILSRECDVVDYSLPSSQRKFVSVTRV